MIGQDCPLFVPLVENGFADPGDPVPQLVAERYLRPLREQGVDTLILGCTHYPLVAPMLQRILGRDVRLVSGGHAVAAAVQRTLESAGLARESRGEGTYDFLCTGDCDSFHAIGTRFLQMPLGEVERVEI